MRESIPGQLLMADELRPWAESAGDIKRRHFIIEGQTLKLFGRRGKTYKGGINLLQVTSLKPTSDKTAPAGALELQVRASRTRSQTCILAPDHSTDDLFLELGNVVPSHVTSAELWRKHMGSRPANTSEHNREYRVGKTLGSGTFGKVRVAALCCTMHPPRYFFIRALTLHLSLSLPYLTGEARPACGRRALCDQMPQPQPPSPRVPERPPRARDPPPKDAQPSERHPVARGTPYTLGDPDGDGVREWRRFIGDIEQPAAVYGE